MEETNPISVMTASYKPTATPKPPAEVYKRITILFGIFIALVAIVIILAIITIIYYVHLKKKRKVLPEAFEETDNVDVARSIMPLSSNEWKE